MTSPDSQPDQPTTPPKKSRRKLWIILGVVGGLLLLCCCGSVGFAVSRSGPTTAATTAPSPQATKTTPENSPSGPDRMICQVTENGGTYYINVTSAGDHNFSVCLGSPLYPGTIDDLLNLPHMDRRCLGSNEYVARNKALVGVYSDTKPLNLKAAKDWCALNKLTNE